PPARDDRPAGRVDLPRLRTAFRSGLGAAARRPRGRGSHRQKGRGHLIAAATIRLPFLLGFAAILFSCGVYGVLARKNAVLVLMSIELMLNAVNVNLVAFSTALHQLTGQVFALFVITVAAAAVGLGGPRVFLTHRNRSRRHVAR